MKLSKIAVAAVVMSLAPAAFAVPVFNYIRLGDQDGFGFASTAGLQRTGGAAADTNGNNLLQQGEFLPDVNRNGSVATGSGDDWDNRSAAEKANTAAPGGVGFVNNSSSGSKWTDITLSTSFLNTFPGNTDFPDPAGPATPNQPQFIYDFSVAGADIVTGAQMFFNLVFGDYDVQPANVTLTFASAPSRVIALNTQAGAADGLIQAASALLDFNEVFTSDGLGGWNGFVRVDFVAANEPYTAFDFTELSVTQIPGTVDLPATLPLIGAGLLALAMTRRQRSR